MGYGIRVVLVMNRKGGSGKSTLCRALASAAAARGETVTIFDTDSSKSCLKWMQAGQEAGNWSSLVEVIHTLDVHRVVEAIGHIYEQQDQEHLILIDTFGGGSEAQDVLAVAAHCIICPMMLSRGDLSETLETASWYLILRNRVEKPEDLAGFTVTFSRVPARLSETERSVAEELFRYSVVLSVPLAQSLQEVSVNRILEGSIAAMYAVLKRHRITPDITMTDRTWAFIARTLVEQMHGQMDVAYEAGRLVIRRPI